MINIIAALVLLIFSQLSLAAPVERSAFFESKHVRALHFVLRGVSLKQAYQLVDRANDAGFNCLVVQISDGLSIAHAPWSADKNAWTREEFQSWAAYARSKGLQLVPELQLLTHQEKLLQGNYPSLMFNEKTYNPANPIIYKKYLFPLMDEIIAVLQPEAFHIGHDEVAGWTRKRKLLPGVRAGNLPDEQLMISAELFFAGCSDATWLFEGEGDRNLDVGGYANFSRRVPKHV